MILSKSPVRIAFGGGGTDVEPYSTDYEGFVVNAPIDQYFRQFIKKRTDSLIKLYANEKFTSYNYKEVERLGDKNGTIDIFEAIFLLLKLNYGYDFYSHEEPPKKAGLGASASLCVSTIAGILELEELKSNKNQIAELAFRVEDEILKNPGGRQDQYAAVYGGFNGLEFRGDSDVKVNRLKISSSFINLIQDNLVLFYTGEPHTSGDMVGKQIDSYLTKKEESKKSLDKLKEIAYQVRDCLLDEDFELFGKLLTEDWKKKSKFNPLLTSDYMKELNLLLEKNGAIGGRVCGAGGGGCVIWLIKPKSRETVRKILKRQKGFEILYKFVDEGLSVMSI